jgi:hypothetical protein
MHDARADLRFARGPLSPILQHHFVNVGVGVIPTQVFTGCLAVLRVEHHADLFAILDLGKGQQVIRLSIADSSSQRIEI